MNNKIINIATVAEIALALKELKDKMIFVGGAVVSLYADNDAVEEVRQTDDVDVTINLVNYASWVQMQERLATLGFSPDPEGHAICSYLYKGISVDIMPSEDGPIGTANKWFKIGFNNLRITTVKGIEVQILSAPCFLATKFEAFNNRGRDYRTSHDFEDIIYVLDNRTTIVEDIKNDHLGVRQFLKKEITKIINSNNFLEIISCHMHPLIIEDRLPILKEKIQKIIAN